MFKNIKHKEFYLHCRLQFMEAMKIALNLYKETGDEGFVERAKEMGSASEHCKKELEELK